MSSVVAVRRSATALNSIPPKRKRYQEDAELRTLYTSAKGAFSSIPSSRVGFGCSHHSPTVKLFVLAFCERLSCARCKRDMSITFESAVAKQYTTEEMRSWQPFATFECRGGVELVRYVNCFAVCTSLCAQVVSCLDFMWSRKCCAMLAHVSHVVGQIGTPSIFGEVQH